MFFSVQYRFVLSVLSPRCSLLHSKGQHHKVMMKCAHHSLLLYVPMYRLYVFDGMSVRHHTLVTDHTLVSGVVCCVWHLAL